MFGLDAPTALLVLLGGFALVATLSMRRMASFGGDDDVKRERRFDPAAILVGAIVILLAILGSAVVLGVWP